MKKTTPKKMELTRETLGTLQDSQVKEIMGGQVPWTSNSVNACCA